ncbi:MAG: tRNA (N6-isopentenyl adenosine(37)-C2)-methylthiotransferase MiaB [Nitrospirota bacterium]|nr:tRNA (N6-isopentenyl adenosine(37)-C2)-methylthiotransferase MiaB [Nitrospirota bacterium]
MMKTVFIRTFGCQMNVHDSEKMLGVLQKDGYFETHDPRKADLIIFNTCGIRQKAEQKFYSELGKTKSYKKRRPEMKVAVAGCIAQHEGGNLFTRAPYVDFVFGPQNIHMLHDIVSRRNRSLALEDNPDIAKEDLPVKRGDEVKAWVTIMYGCNNYCSYCVVPYTRGRERSRSSENICAEIKELAEQGYKEITLLGQNVNSYRSDINFPGLLRRLERVGGIERIRFVTSHPGDLSDELMDAIAELTKVCEHIHLPLQSGSNNVLRLMNRRYTYEEYMKKVLRLRDKVQGIAITSDIIAGFPGETEEDHIHTVKALKEIEFDGIFAFKFSSRPGTRAEEMKGHLSKEVKSERLQQILEIQEEITEKKNRSLEGTTHEILIEGESVTDKGKLTGRTRTNKIVNIPKVESEKGTVLHVEITRGRQHSLEGKVIKE